MQKSTYQTTKIFGLSVFSSSYESLLNFLKTHLKSKTQLLTIVTPNPEQIVLSRSDHNFLDHLRSADLAIPDGIGLVMASRVFSTLKGGQSITERLAGVDVVSALLKEAETQDYSVLVIGGRGYGKATGLPQALSSLGLNKLAGYSAQEWYWVEGFADIAHPTEEETKRLAAAVKAVKPTIVFVAFGAPFQEEWIATNRTLLEKTNVKLAMVVGGAFDILLEKIPRAPKGMRSLGLEWLFRLWQEPWRWKRQAKLLQFLKLVIQEL